MDVVQPHILKADGGEVATVPADPGRALLVLPSEAAAESFGEGVGFEVAPVFVDPGEIEAVCAKHNLALVGLYGFTEPGELMILSPETVSEGFEELD